MLLPILPIRFTWGNIINFLKNNNSKRLGEILIENKIISEEELLSVLGELLGTGYLEDIDKLINPGLGIFFLKI